MLHAFVPRICGSSTSIICWWRGCLIQGFTACGPGFRFSFSCKVVGFAVYHLRSYSCSVFKAYLHLWNSGGPNWFIEWQRYSAEESKSWKLVSHRRSSPALFAIMSRKPALSGANLVPLGHQKRSVRDPAGLKQRLSVFDRISFPLRSVSDHEVVVRPHFQNYSNRRIGRMVRSGFRPSLEAPRVSPWAPRMLVWRSKKILEQCPENFGQDSIPGINGSSVPAASGDQHFRDLSLCGNNSQIFGISGQKCNRPVGSFPDKFANASWGFPPRLWFRPPLLSLTGGPPHLPSFNNFGEFSQAVLSSADASPSTELALFAKPHSAPLPWKNPSPSCSLLSVVPLPPSHSSILGAAEEMAFRRVDPTPFLPHGFVAQQVDHREIMVRTVTRPQPSTHEDWGIVLVHPLPEHEVNFHIFDDIIREYLVEVRRVQVRSIQRSHLGQALVRFRFAFDRDNLVALGPQQALGFSFTVICHNEGWNQRALTFNHECWLILLSFPMGFWTHEHIQNAVGAFGRVLMWDPDPNNATRLLVRARVTSLQEVPQFIVFSVAEGFQGVSWTVQCDIVQQFMLDAQPQDEDLVPPYPHDSHQLPVEFFGMGQPMPNFHFQFDLNIPPEEGINAEENVATNVDDGWDPWPVEQAHPPMPEVLPNNVNAAINEEEQFSFQVLRISLLTIRWAILTTSLSLRESSFSRMKPRRRLKRFSLCLLSLLKT
jgi:hypothetical protein